MKQVHKKEIDIIQKVLDAFNSKVDIVSDINLWNHCIHTDDERIEIIEE